MGTAHEWFLAFIVGVLFGGFMSLMNFSRPKFVNPPRIYWMLFVLDNALFGLWLGVLEAFRGWRPFRPPLVYLFVGIFVCGMLVSFSLRRITRNLPRLPKKPAPFPVPDFSRTEKILAANDAIQNESSAHELTVKNPSL